MNVTTFRYLYTKNGVDGLQCSIITGSDTEHANFINMLHESDDVVLALREYVCTYESGMIGMTEKIKIKEEKSHEEIESN